MNERYYQCRRCKKIVNEKDMRKIVFQESFLFWKIPVENELCKYCCEELKKN